MNQLLDDFITVINQKGIRLHGVYVIQHGKLVAERYLTPDIARNIYSVSKSFMSTAVGILLDEGLLKMTDKPVDYFPRSLPDNLDDRYLQLTLQNLLTMTSGHARPILHEDERYSIKERDWIRFIFSQPLVSAPGEQFMYSNSSAYLAGCMAEKAAGIKLNDFLYERCLKYMGIPYPEWEECPMEHTFAASRLYLRLSDMAKLGVLYLNGGNYEGRRILSQEWVKSATSFKTASKRVSTYGTGEDENYGYGYQFWMCRYPGIFRAFGRRGQFVIVVPDKDAVIATSADENDEQSILNAVWENILPKL